MSERMIWVCSACKTASCWHGEFMCEQSRDAGIEQLPETELRKLNREHPSHYSEEKLREVYGR